MKVVYGTGNVRFEQEVESFGEGIAFMAMVDVVFGEDTCGACQSKNVRMEVRRAQSYTFREMTCQACGAALTFFENNADGSLFPIRKDKQKNPMPNNGWKKYIPQQQPQQSEQHGGGGGYSAPPPDSVGNEPAF